MRKAAIAFESRDSLLIRTAVKLGLTMDYETDSVTEDGKGGPHCMGIPAPAGMDRFRMGRTI